MEDGKGAAPRNADRVVTPQKEREKRTMNPTEASTEAQDILFNCCGYPVSTNTAIVIGIVIAVIVIGIVAWILTKKCPCAKGSCDTAPSPTRKEGDLTEIYVGNLSYDMNEAQFRKEFERFGVVKTARIIGHRTSGKSKGYGFIEMPHRKEAMLAIKNLNGKDIMGRRLRVNEARNGTRIG